MDISQKEAELKYKKAFVLMMILMACGVVCCLLIIPNLKGEVFGHFANKILLAGIGVFFTASFMVGKQYWKYKDIATYDEFGVRKDEKRRMEMDSTERRQLEMQSLAELERVIPRNTIEKITHSGSTNAEKDLADLVGIEPVKERLYEMKARMEFEEEERAKTKGKGKNKNSNPNEEGHHMVFYGNPGTGKTTVARILTNILYEYEYIERNELIEVDGNFLKSGDPSMTETKVRFICKSAHGGVLFIDEAYSLGGDKIGETAIATLIKEMEDHRDKFVVILAGYSGPMGKMLETNPGFKSRIKEYLDFPDYSQPELLEIFKRMAKGKGFEVDDSCDKPLTLRLGMERSLTSWGNARTVRNVLEETIDKHAVNFVKGNIAKEDKYKLFGADICTEPKALL